MSRREAADSAVARQGERDKVTDDLELKLSSHAKEKAKPPVAFTRPRKKFNDDWVAAAGWLSKNPHALVFHWPDH